MEGPYFKICNWVDKICGCLRGFIQARLEKDEGKAYKRARSTKGSIEQETYVDGVAQLDLSGKTLKSICEGGKKS